ncbi:MAG TPA: hypothetical protein DEF47_21725 [Herpetosiphon sp.]|uniref:Uncharacterized protein n=1 Tax=Herpetosiphon aurantiacus (strain ATCC 23779 / DSM 785 / 114-95) TaxID=316274 RepID=A9AVX6_HERA2|nr:hypothetical protein [Herpetosiphon sp.]ABX03214.1 hypothetical protein Haur_0566 [Herpetosiphon aurantiacus DSM 785]HBW52510.1 hypothetical protein [Herpetosiphon sp.]
MTLTQTLLALMIVAVLSFVIGFLKSIAPKAAEALHTWADANLGAEQRDALYGAVKAGLRAAEAHGLKAEDLLAKAVQVASGYLTQYGLPFSETLLRDLVMAEKYKKTQESE